MMNNNMFKYGNNNIQNDNYKMNKEIKKSNYFMKKDSLSLCKTKKTFTFNENLFPKLIDAKDNLPEKSSDNNVTTKSLFKQIINSNLELEGNKEDEKQEVQYKKGWVVIREYKKKTVESEEAKKSETKEEEIKDNYIKNTKNAFKKIVKNYELWKMEYIENWGPDDYEYNYRFPNHDYDYFDKLDEEDQELNASDYNEYYNSYYDDLPRYE